MSFTFSRNWLISLAVTAVSLLLSRACTGRGGTPVFWGSVSDMFSENFFPRRMRAALWSFSVWIKNWIPGIIISRIFSHIFVFISSGILPALLSVILLFSSIVAKFTRAARSPSRMGNLIPSAERIPLPIIYSSGSYPNKARCPGPLPGVIPGIIGVINPASETFTSLSIFGVSAASSSVFLFFCTPPSPSSTRSTIFSSEGCFKFRISSSLSIHVSPYIHI
ncbi:hypothetical protein ES703_09690 [subsurface metagenome]